MGERRDYGREDIRGQMIFRGEDSVNGREEILEERRFWGEEC